MEYIFVFPQIKKGISYNGIEYFIHSFLIG